MFNLIQLSSVPIWEQLRLEEALFRADTGNYCLVNQGSEAAVILGLSARPEEMLHLDRLGEIPLWRRFSGGGTVVVDQETLFVSFIGNAADFGLQPYPHDLFDWSHTFYKNVFLNELFALKENDYVIGGRKVGGNAQAFARNRFVHHTSFLWDYREEAMDLLKMPPKMPVYREGRPHTDFLTTLKGHFGSKRDFLERVGAAWKESFASREKSLEELIPFLTREHRRSLSEVKHRLEGLAGS